jgi:diaminopimelate epimerase
MVRNDNCIVPYVYVKKTDSFVAEGSCGSGAVAMAFADSEQTRKPYKTAYSFPRGTLEVSIKRTLSNAFEAKMGGEVKELKIM